MMVDFKFDVLYRQVFMEWWVELGVPSLHRLSDTFRKIRGPGAMYVGVTRGQSFGAEMSISYLAIRFNYFSKRNRTNILDTDREFQKK